MSIDSCLNQGRPPQSLLEVKDFVRYYLNSHVGAIELKPTLSTTLNLAERFFAGFERVTGSVFNSTNVELQKGADPQFAL